MGEDIADLLNRVAAIASGRVVERLGPETRDKLDLLLAARERIAADPDWRPPSADVMEALAGEVLSALDTVPQRIDWRTLPPSGAAPVPKVEAPRADPGRPAGPPGPRGAEGPLAWILGLAVLTVMAMSIWL